MKNHSLLMRKAEQRRENGATGRERSKVRGEEGKGDGEGETGGGTGGGDHAGGRHGGGPTLVTAAKVVCFRRNTGGRKRKGSGVYVSVHVRAYVRRCICVYSRVQKCEYLFYPKRPWI